MKTFKNISITTIITFMMLVIGRVALSQPDSIFEAHKEIGELYIADQKGIHLNNIETTQNPNSFIARITFTEASHKDKCDALVQASVYGGIPPFTFVWNNCSVGTTIKNACSGSYTVTVTDAFGKRTTASRYVGYKFPKHKSLKKKKEFKKQNMVRN